MIGVFLVIMGLAAVFGFFLSVYFFLYRANISPSMRWPAAIIGGFITGGFMVGLTLLILWPPLNVLVTLGMLALACVITAYALGGGKRRGMKKESAYCTLSTEDGGGNDEDVDSYGLDLDARARS